MTGTRRGRWTTDGIEPLLEETVEVAAPPSRVWDLVSDLPRLAEWSPQVVRSIARPRGPVRSGTRLLNLNRRGLLLWPTRAEVVRFEPGTHVAFRIKENGSTWSFTLEPLRDGGTRLVQRREAPYGIHTASKRLTDLLLGGEATFQAELRAGMRATLAGIRETAEAR